MNPYGNSGYIGGGDGYSMPQIPGYGYNAVPQPANSDSYSQFQQSSMYPNMGAAQNFSSQPGYPGMPDYQNSSLYYSGAQYSSQPGYPGMPNIQQMPQQNYSTAGTVLPSWQSGYAPYATGYGQPSGQEYNSAQPYQTPPQQQGSYEYNVSNSIYTNPIPDNYNSNSTAPAASYTGYSSNNFIGGSNFSNVSSPQDFQKMVPSCPPSSQNLSVSQPQLKPDRPPSPKFPVSTDNSSNIKSNSFLQVETKDMPTVVQRQAERTVVVVNSKSISNSSNVDSKQDRQAGLNKFADLMKDMTFDEEQQAMMKNRYT